MTQHEVRLKEALNAAAYALFQVKRLVDAGPITQEFVREAHRKACSVLDGEAHPPEVVPPQAEALKHIRIWKGEGQNPKVYISLDMGEEGFWSYSDDHPDGVIFALHFKEKFSIRGVERDNPPSGPNE